MGRLIDEMRRKRAGGGETPNSCGEAEARLVDGLPPAGHQWTARDFPAPEPDGVTGFHAVPPITSELWGCSPLGHLALGMVRGQGFPVARLYSPQGEIVGLTAWDPRPAGLLACSAGRAMLRGELPTAPIPVPEGIYAPAIGSLANLPYSGVKAVLVTRGLETTVRGAVWACRPRTLKKYGSGIPVVGYESPGDAELLGDVRWPGKATILVRDHKTAREVGTEVWGHDIVSLT